METQEQLDENQIIEFLVEKLPLKNNISKLAEECAELLEVLLKYMTRREGKEPDRKRIAEELSHVMFRSFVVMAQMGMEDEISAEINKKMIELSGRITSGYFDKQDE